MYAILGSAYKAYRHLHRKGGHNYSKAVLISATHDSDTGDEYHIRILRIVHDERAPQPITILCGQMRVVPERPGLRLSHHQRCAGNEIILFERLT